MQNVRMYECRMMIVLTLWKSLRDHLLGRLKKEKCLKGDSSGTLNEHD